ncbi:MAG TPA: phospholipase D-like domain-containing protein [Allosphingosinicella sp.]|nr:phospholipase D-like domain-containing protein [Allosphingosinicella sp.]
MRVLAEPSAKGLRARAIAGTYVVLIAFDCDVDYCEGLLGFAIRRIDHEKNEDRWLSGLKKFDLPEAGDDVTTHAHPVQKFHWGDYTARAGCTYTYEVHAMRGKKGALVDDDSVSLTVTCERPEGVGKNGHAVHFNRSAASSQAFARRFPALPPGEVDDPEARAWLSRGLQESLIAFIEQAQAGEGLHLFVYEFAKPDYAEALKAARERGVNLQILHDAILKQGKGPILESRPLLEEFGLADVAKDRVASGLAISHNKFVVWTGTDGAPKAVWTGSTNFTDAGVYAQSNVGHAITGPEPAGTYLKWHQTVWNDPTMSCADSRAEACKLTTLPDMAKSPTGTTVVLSPRGSIEAVELCAALVRDADKMVCFTAPFPLHDEIEEALAETPAQTFGLLNRRGVVGPTLSGAPNTSLAAATAFNQESVLEAWQDKMLDRLRAESLHHSGVFIHTKIILVDPLSDHPRIVSGSANFSDNSSRKNDENQLFIFDEPEVADVYLGEFMRMFDHYYYRDHLKMMKAEELADPKAAYLDETDGWTEKFFNGGLRERERVAFF